jgi:hypothetical protein
VSQGGEFDLYQFMLERDTKVLTLELAKRVSVVHTRTRCSCIHMRYDQLVVHSSYAFGLSGELAYKYMLVPGIQAYINNNLPTLPFGKNIVVRSICLTEGQRCGHHHAMKSNALVCRCTATSRRCRRAHPRYCRARPA